MRVRGDGVAYQVQRTDLKSLYSFKVRMDVILWEDDYLITSVGTNMANHDQCVDMTLR